MTGKDLLNNGDLTADGFDDCILGVAEVVIEGKKTRRVLYDAEAMHKQLTAEFTNEDISEDQAAEAALEYLEYNTFGAYVGEKTPIYHWPPFTQAE